VCILCTHRLLPGSGRGARDEVPGYSAGTPATLAPLYDMLSTAVYDHLTPKMAMKLGSKYTFTEVQARHWGQFVRFNIRSEGRCR